MEDFDKISEIFDKINNDEEKDNEENYIIYNNDNVIKFLKIFPKMYAYLDEIDLSDLDLSFEQFESILNLVRKLVNASSYFINDIESKKTFLKDNIDHLMKKIEV